MDIPHKYNNTVIIKTIKFYKKRFSSTLCNFIILNFNINSLGNIGMIVTNYIIVIVIFLSLLIPNFTYLSNFIFGNYYAM